MKIGMVSPYDCSHAGGVCRHAHGLARELISLGHQVVAIAPRSTGGGVRAGDGFYEIGRSIWVAGNGSRARITFDVTQARAVAAILRQERFDVLHVQEPFMPLLPHLVLYNSDTTNVGTFHTFRRSSPWYGVFRPYLARLARHLHGRIAVSEAARTFVQSYFDGNYAVIPNGVDRQLFNTSASPLPWSSDGRRRVVFVGRFEEPRKGFRVLLDALPTIVHRCPDMQLIVAGPGDASRYRWLASEFSRDSVRFVGPVSEDQMPALLRSCDVLCAPSLGSESFGLILVEAMACGLPVVASAIPGYQSVVTHGRDGLLCKPGDSRALVACVTELLMDGTAIQALGAAAANTATRYAWSRVAPQVLDIYRHAATQA